MFHCLATFSAVSPIENGKYLSASLFFTNRHPIVDSQISVFLLHPLSLLAIAHGALVILSTPPAIYNIPSSHIIALEASIIACKPLAHNLFTVLPATLTGNPASNAA